MAVNTVKVTMKVRSDTAANWASQNPTLLAGEVGVELDTLLIKIGTGSSAWNDLRYVNKLNSTQFIYDDNGNITLTSSVTEILESAITTDGGTITGTLNITNDPENDTEAANKHYVDVAVANAGHLTREIITELPAVDDAEENVIYMIKDETVEGLDKYREYLLINGALEAIGDTSVDLNNLVTNGTTGNLVKVGSDGELVDTGIAAEDIGKLKPATADELGGVKSSTNDNYIQVDNSGFMTLNRVSTSLLYVPAGDELVLNGGQA